MWAGGRGEVREIGRLRREIKKGMKERGERWVRNTEGRKDEEKEKARRWALKRDMGKVEL